MSTVTSDGAIVELREAYDYLAPDGSEIRLLKDGPLGGLCHCQLPAGGISAAVAHQTVEELWYFLEGRGEVWRQNHNEGAPVRVSPGMSLRIPCGTAFQFRNTGHGLLRFRIATMPRWPGAQEAVPAKGYW